MSRAQMVWGAPYGGQKQRGKSTTIAVERVRKLLRRFTEDDWHSLTVDVFIPPEPAIEGWLAARDTRHPGRDLSPDDLRSLEQIVPLPEYARSWVERMDTVDLSLVLQSAAPYARLSLSTRRGDSPAGFDDRVDEAAAFAATHQGEQVGGFDRVTVSAHARITRWLDADGHVLPHQNPEEYTKKQGRPGGSATGHAPSQSVMLNARLPFTDVCDELVAWIRAVREHTGLHLTPAQWRKLTPGGGRRKVRF